MAHGGKVALAVGAGYLLGRTRKMRVALMLAAAGITGKFPGNPTQLVAHGLKSLGASADVSELSQQLRGELLDAARAAALAAATHRVDALNDRLQGVTSTVGADELLEDVGDTVGDTVDRAGEPVRSLTGLGRKRRRDDEDRYEEDDDTYEDDEPLDVDEDIDEDEEPDDDDLDEDDLETEPADDEPQAARPRRRAAGQDTAPSTARAPRRRATTTATKRAPVRRGR